MRTAVVLFNLGGPDAPEAVKPFLFNLFNDKAIINLPQPLRWCASAYLSARRASAAAEIYEEMGGRSPILELTQQQAAALEGELQPRGEYKVFTAMRYWHPFIAETLREVKQYGPKRVILLPLYPQFSTATTASALAAWCDLAKKEELEASHHPVCCYPFDDHFVEAHVQMIKPDYEAALKYGKPRLLFSAHGLPQKTVAKGDPYQWQVEKTVAVIMRKLGAVDHAICYQSRVGPLKWLEPSTASEIARAGQDGVPVVVVPVAFVSEHSETLVELDIEYRRLAHEKGVPYYTRAAALGTHPEYIRSLAWLVEATNLYPNCSNSLGRLCPKEFGKCGFRQWGH